MTTTSEYLEQIIDTKDCLANLITDNGGTVPSLFGDYPETIDNIIENINNIILFSNRKL